MELDAPALAVPDGAQASGGDAVRTGPEQRAADMLAEALRASCQTWHCIDGKSRIFLTRDGDWLASDEQAEAVLVDNIAGLSLDQGRLRANGKMAKRFDRLLKAGREPVTIVMPKKDWEGHVILRSSAYNDTTVGVLAYDSENKADAEFASLEEAFGLTPAEANVVHAMVNGYSAAEIAEDRNLSINTVRVHLRHCYEKLGVSSREQLWRKIHPYFLI
ncbi:hypothetical protein GRI43_12760 [Altererythrobacter luteolus]|uniref:HTH luxR-type domain-containing protein n=1 Tax=Pontixanthobacter luteolus TaxID=295089 RepID=A0A6I4V1T6_9SPHN|nr:helix-turn-helix domain-containing protein [Pontixanthobacter luteolus]MXP48259.1 hypothetical protein [Pontixanthobacter luteolus]